MCRILSATLQSCNLATLQKCSTPLTFCLNKLSNPTYFFDANIFRRNIFRLTIIEDIFQSNQNCVRPLLIGNLLGSKIIAYLLHLFITGKFANHFTLIFSKQKKFNYFNSLTEQGPITQVSHFL